MLSCCATDWQYTSSFSRSRQTKLIVESEPQGQVFVNKRYVGEAPITASVEYGQEVRVKTRKVSYWYTQPGLSLAVSILSLGIYVPFSFIPVDIESAYEPSIVFQNNIFSVVLETEGYETWESTVVCTGEETLLVPTVLNKDRNYSSGGKD
jgi:hypothetical protein